VSNLVPEKLNLVSLYLKNLILALVPKQNGIIPVNVISQKGLRKCKVTLKKMLP